MLAKYKGTEIKQKGKEKNSQLLVVIEEEKEYEVEKILNKKKFRGKN